MDANEIIEYYSKQLDFCKSQVFEINCAGKEQYGEQLTETLNELNYEIERIESLLSILDRARIRITKDEPPVWDYTNDNCVVLAHCKAFGWAIIRREVVAAHPDIYTKWTQLPEVTP